MLQIVQTLWSVLLAIMMCFSERSKKMKAFPLVSIPPYKNKSPKIITLGFRHTQPTIGHTSLIYRWYRLERGEEHESNRTHQHFDTIIKPSSLNWSDYCIREREKVFVIKQRYIPFVITTESIRWLFTWWHPSLFFGMKEAYTKHKVTETLIQIFSKRR